MPVVRGRAGAGSSRGRDLTPGSAGTGGRPGHNLGGAPPPPAPREQARQRPYPKPPPDWMASELEWIIYWWLKYKERWEENKDFYYNGRVFVPGLYSSSPFTQSDFIIDLGPNSRAGTILPYSALVLDPFTEFTHDIRADLDRWDAMQKAGYLLIFMAEADVKDRTDFVIREALTGADHSNRMGRG